MQLQLCALKPKWRNKLLIGGGEGGNPSEIHSGLLKPLQWHTNVAVVSKAAWQHMQSLWVPELGRSRGTVVSRADGPWHGTEVSYQSYHMLLSGSFL